MEPSLPAHLLRATDRKWYRRPGPVIATREIIISNGHIQRIGILCPHTQFAEREPVRHWPEVLLDTGTGENIASEYALRQYGLDHMIKKKASACIETYNHDPIAIIGEIELQFKWAQDDDGTVFGGREIVDKFQVAAAPDDPQLIPEYFIIFGRRHLGEARISVMIPASDAGKTSTDSDPESEHSYDG